MTIEQRAAEVTARIQALDVGITPIDPAEYIAALKEAGLLAEEPSFSSMLVPEIERLVRLGRAVETMERWTGGTEYDAGFNACLNAICREARVKL